MTAELNSRVLQFATSNQQPSTIHTHTHTQINKYIIHVHKTQIKKCIYDIGIHKHTQIHVHKNTHLSSIFTPA